MFAVALAAVVACCAIGSPVHADTTPVEVAVGLPPVPPTSVEVAVGLPPVPPTSVEVAVGLPPVPPTSVEVAVGLPPVPPTSVEVAVGLPPVAPLVRSHASVQGRQAEVDPRSISGMIADAVETVAAGLALIADRF